MTIWTLFMSFFQSWVNWAQRSRHNAQGAELLDVYFSNKVVGAVSK